MCQRGENEVIYLRAKVSVHKLLPRLSEQLTASLFHLRSMLEVVQMSIVMMVVQNALQIRTIQHVEAPETSQKKTKHCTIKPNSVRVMPGGYWDILFSGTHSLRCAKGRISRLAPASYLARAVSILSHRRNHLFA